MNQNLKEHIYGVLNYFSYGYTSFYCEKDHLLNLFKECEKQGYVMVLSESERGVRWVLTEKGEQAAKMIAQLRYL
jgi:hypothetical protein